MNNNTEGGSEMKIEQAKKMYVSNKVIFDEADRKEVIDEIKKRGARK